MELKKTWKSKKSRYGYSLIMFGGTIMLLGLLLFGTNYTETSIKQQQRIQLEGAIKRAVAQCYAIEGMYPPNMEYIKKYYGIGVDERKFIVHYEIFATNIYPDIMIIEKNWGDDDE